VAVGCCCDVEDESVLGGRSLLVVAECLAFHALGAELVGEGLVVGEALESQADVESCFESADCGVGELSGEVVGDVAAFGRVDAAAAAQVAVEGSSSEEFDESGLGEDRVSEVEGCLSSGCFIDEVVGDYEPSESERGGEGFGNAGAGDDAFGAEGLERANGLVVISVFGVVVVFDDVAARFAVYPVEKLVASFGCECDTGGVVVGGGE